MPALVKKKTPSVSAWASEKEEEEEEKKMTASSPDALAELLLADPVANANCLPRLLALETVPTDEVRVKEN